MSKEELLAMYEQEYGDCMIRKEKSMYPNGCVIACYGMNNMERFRVDINLDNIHQRCFLMKGEEL